MEIGWDPEGGVEPTAAYEILRGGRTIRTIDAASSALRHEESGLEPWTEYCYRIRAVDASGNRSESAGPACARTLDTTPPSPPGHLGAAAASDTRIDLRWSPAADRAGVAAYEVLREGSVMHVGPGTEATETGLAPGRRYCYAVRALDAAGNASPEAGPLCVVTPDLSAPSAPESFAATAVSEAQIELSWNASVDDVGVTEYEVQRGKAPVASVAAPGMTHADLAAGTQYCFTVRARDAAGNRSAVVGPACATTPDLTPPSAPTHGRAEPRSETSVEIAWEPATDNVGVTTYEVARDDVVRVRSGAAPAVDGGLKAATRYCYTIRARDAAGNRSKPLGPVCVTTPDLTPPSVPAGLAAAPTGESRIEVRWQSSRDNVSVAAYEVRRGELPVATTTSPGAAEGGLRAWSEHCYSVVAVDRAGNRSEAAGPACARTRDETPPSPPAQVHASGAPPDRIDLRWAASTDNGEIAAYEVRRDANVIARVTEPAATASGLRPGVQYCHSVTAIDAAGNRSPEAPPACAIVPDVTPPSAPGEVSAKAISENEIRLRWSPSTDDHRVEGYEVVSGGHVVATGEAAAASIGGVRAAVEYCYTVRAKDAAGNVSPESSPACATVPDQTAPSAPPGLAAIPVSDTEVRLRWREATDNVAVTAYAVVRDRAELGVVQTLDFAEGGLRAATRYCYEVRARDAAGNRSPVAGPACTTTPDLKPPSTPSRFEVAAGSATISLGWSPSSDDVGVAGYEVLRDRKILAKVADTAHSESGDAGKRYCYSVRAFDAAGNRSPETPPACAVAPDVTPPSAPGRFAVASVTETRADLRWSASTDNVAVAGYELVRAGNVVATVANTAARDGSLSPARDYCWLLRAFDAAGNRSAQTGPVCAATPDLTPPSIAGALSAAADGEDVVELGWPAATDNVEVVAYDVERDGAELATVVETRLRDPDRHAATRYCYSVRARDAAGHLSKPATACVSTPDLKPPTPPGDPELAPTATQVALRWTEATDNVGLDAYEVLRGPEVVARTTATVAKESRLSPRTEYCYSVVAVDAAGNRSTAAGPVCTTTLAPYQPPAPRHLVAATVSPGAIDLRWDASPGKNTVYRVYAGDMAVGATRYLRFHVKGSAARCFAVKAVDLAGHESSRSNEACATAVMPAAIAK